MPHLLDSRAGARVKAEQHGTRRVELLLDPDQLFIWIGGLALGSLVGELGQVVVSQDGEGFFQEPGAELVQHLAFHEVG